MSDQQPWTWNTWDYVHCVQCGNDLPARPTCEPGHFCSIQCAYTYGVNFHEQRGGARIAAERAAVPSDEELLSVFERAWRESFERDGDREYHNNRDVIAGIRAVCAALGPQVPVIPQADDIIDLLQIRAKKIHLMDGTYLPEWLDEEREALREFLGKFAAAQEGGQP